MIEEKLRNEILGNAKRKQMRGRGDGKMTDEDREDNIHRICNESRSNEVLSLSVSPFALIYLFLSMSPFSLSLQIPLSLFPPTLERTRDWITHY